MQITETRKKHFMVELCSACDSNDWKNTCETLIFITKCFNFSGGFLYQYKFQSTYSTKYALNSYDIICCFDFFLLLLH